MHSDQVRGHGGRLKAALVHFFSWFAYATLNVARERVDMATPGSSGFLFSSLYVRSSFCILPVVHTPAWLGHIGVRDIRFSREQYAAQHQTGREAPMIDSLMLASLAYLLRWRSSSYSLSGGSVSPASHSCDFSSSRVARCVGSATKMRFKNACQEREKVVAVKKRSISET